MQWSVKHVSQQEESSFTRSDTRIPQIIPTCALGMGVDNPDVEFIVHYEIPKEVESYVREIGRGGRDAKA